MGGTRGKLRGQAWHFPRGGRGRGGELNRLYILETGELGDKGNYMNCGVMMWGATRKPGNATIVSLTALTHLNFISHEKRE